MKINSFPVDFLGKIEIIAENKYLMMNVGLVIEQKITESFEKNCVGDKATEWRQKCKKMFECVGFLNYFL